LFARQCLEAVYMHSKRWIEKWADFPSDRGKSYELGPHIPLILVSNTIKYINLDMSLTKIYSRKVCKAAIGDKFMCILCLREPSRVGHWRNWFSNSKWTIYWQIHLLPSILLWWFIFILIFFFVVWSKAESALTDWTHNRNSKENSRISAWPCH
jgi:hypothetical protein